MFPHGRGRAREEARRPVVKEGAHVALIGDAECATVASVAPPGKRCQAGSSLCHLHFEGGDVGGKGQLAVQLQAEEGGRFLEAERLAAEPELRLDLSATLLGIQREGGEHALRRAGLDLPGFHPVADLIQGRLEAVRALLQRSARGEEGDVVREE